MLQYLLYKFVIRRWLSLTSVKTACFAISSILLTQINTFLVSLSSLLNVSLCSTLINKLSCTLKIFLWWPTLIISQVKAKIVNPFYITLIQFMPQHQIAGSPLWKHGIKIYTHTYKMHNTISRNTSIFSFFFSVLIKPTVLHNSFVIWSYRRHQYSKHC